MLAKLKGQIDALGPDWVVLDVNGVGYQAFCSSRSLSQLGGVGAFTTIYTEMLVSQDMIRLVGFATIAERDWFRLLHSVQGVGTRVALAILSTLSVAEISQAIALQDKAMIGRASGVGKKLADRIVLELKDKVPALTAGDSSLAQISAELQAPLATPASDAVSALVNLGYGQVPAGLAVAAALRKHGDDLPTEKLIRQALKELALT